MQTLQQLVAAYEALAQVPPEQSRTAALIARRDAPVALARLRTEIRELAAVVAGGHGHAADKTERPRRLLRDRGLDASAADLLLEASQVSYWWLVAQHAQGRSPDAAKLHAALTAGAAAGEPARPFGEQAASAAARPTAEAVYGLLGRAMADRGLSLDLFAELDLAEMASRPYLQGALRGP